MHHRVLAEKIFIIPDFTAVVELVLFVFILAVMWTFVVPSVQRSMRERRGIVQRELEEAERAKSRLATAEEEYGQVLTDIRTEATQIRDEARQEGQRFIRDVEERATREHEARAAEHAARLEADRGRVLDDLRDDVDRLSLQMAGRILGEPIDDSVLGRLGATPPVLPSAGRGGHP